MKSFALLATFPLFFFIKFINGQQNDVGPSENFKTFNYMSQNQHTRKVINGVEIFLDQNGNIIPLPKNDNHNQILMQTNVPEPIASMQQLQLPPDIKPQPLQVQQHLKLQTPLQLQQSLPLQAQLQKQTPIPLQNQQPLQLQSDNNAQLPLQYTQPPLQFQRPPVQFQDSLQSQQPMQSIRQLQPHIQLQPQIQSHPQTQAHPHVQTQPQVQAQPQMQVQSEILPYPQIQAQLKSPSKEPLQLQQTLQMQQSSQPKQLHQYLEVPQPLLLQQPPLRESQAFKLPQSSLPQQISQLPQPLRQQKPLAELKSVNLVETGVTQQKHTFQPNFKWQSSNSQLTPIVEQPPNLQNPNIQSKKQSIIYPVEIVPNVEKSSIQNFYRNPEVSSLTIASQQGPPSSPISSASFPVVPNSYSNIIFPYQNIKPAEETNIPIISSYNYNNKPVSESHPLVPEVTKPVNSIPQTPPILKVSSPPIQSTNMQTYYYNQQSTNPRQNTYISQNSGYHYPQQSPYPVIMLQSQPTATVPGQSQILSSIPISSVQAPSVSSQYGYSSSYPLNTIVAPAFRSQTTKTSDLKSFLPLIFNLLKEKIAACGCRNDCQCDCKNNNNIPEVSSGYSSQKRYGTNIDDQLSVLNTVSEESEGIECPRERKNCEKIEPAASEISGETQEEEDSEEEDEEAEEEDGEED